jgi:replicative DNA helicase
MEAVGRLSETRVFIDDTPSITPMQLRTKCRRLYAEHGLDLVMIDYLQLMQAERSTNNRVQEISEISRALKGLARELDVPVLAAAQLSRAVEQRQDKRPLLSDLRDSGCLTGDTLVTMAVTGQRTPIRDLVGKRDFTVWALNLDTYQLEETAVTNAFSTGTKQVHRLTTGLGRTIRATGNHKFLTIGGWKRLDELLPGEHIALPRQIPAKNNKQTMSDDELAFLGHMIGDGCTLPRHAIQYTTRERDLAELVQQLAIRLFGDDVNPRINQERSWYQVYLTSTRHHTHGVRSAVSEWLDELNAWGLRSHEKRVPEKVFQQTNQAIATFLRHLWTTDGCIRMTWGKKPRPAIYYATSSSRLAGDVQSLLLHLGINARLKIVAQGDKGRDQHHVVVSGKKDIERFAQQVGAIGSYKTDSLAEITSYINGRNSNTNRDVIPRKIWPMHVKPAMQAINMSHRQLHSAIGIAYSGTEIFKQNISRERAHRVAAAAQSEPLQRLAKSDVYWDQIKSIELDGEEEVFDLTVPGHHNFVANNIVVHNSIEQDADIVMFIYRDEYYNPDTTERPNIAELNIAKHRNGPTGTVDLYWHAKLATFRNLQRQEINL